MVVLLGRAMKIQGRLGVSPPKNLQMFPLKRRDVWKECFVTFQLFQGDICEFSGESEFGKRFCGHFEFLLLGPTSLNKQLGNHLKNPIEVSQSPRLFRKKHRKGNPSAFFVSQSFSEFSAAFCFQNFWQVDPKKTKTSGHFLEKPMFCIPQKKNKWGKKRKLPSFKTGIFGGVVLPVRFPPNPPPDDARSLGNSCKDAHTFVPFWGSEGGDGWHSPARPLSIFQENAGKCGDFPPNFGSKKLISRNFWVDFVWSPPCRHVNFGGRQVFFNTWSQSHLVT